MTQQGIYYLMMWKDGFEPTEVSSNEAKENWPQLVFRFLEKHLVFKTGSTSEVCCVETDNASGQPLKVCCKYCNQIFLIKQNYLCSFTFQM